MKPEVQLIEITADHLHQRLDNFLTTYLKGLPKSALYRVIRRGEVRVNRKRADPSQKLAIGDIVRIPPVHVSEPTAPKISQALLTTLLGQVLYEDEHILVLNKPSGLAVHGGSNIEFGLVETLQAHPEYKNIQLVHRLDRDTSGCLLLAKNRATLTHLHDLMRDHLVEKRYLVLVEGQWPQNITMVSAPLQKFQYGTEFKVEVNPEGKEAITHFTVLETFPKTTLLEARLETGRMHQIRVHCQISGHPVAQDDKYGDPKFNQLLQKQGLKRLFLHAKLIKFQAPHLEKPLAIEAPLAHDLERFITNQRDHAL